MALKWWDDDYKIWDAFIVSNYFRNEILSRNLANLKIKKTGTTIAGLIFDRGVVLASDTRATNSGISCDKNCCKVHFLASNICCCGAGTSADIEFLTNSVSRQLEFQKLHLGKQPSLRAARAYFENVLLESGGAISAAIILGGKDYNGTHLYSIHPHGTVQNLPFCSMGSGSLASIAVLEKYFVSKLKISEAIFIIKEAILAGIYNDLGSGGNLDIALIYDEGISYQRNSYDIKKLKKEVVLKF